MLKDRILIVLILFFTITFAYLNYYKLEQVYDYTFVHPQKYSHSTHVTRIQVSDGDQTVRESLIENSITSPSGFPVFFVQVPTDFNTQKATIEVNDVPLESKLVYDGSVYYTHSGGVTFYFVDETSSKKIVETIDRYELSVQRP